MFTNKAIPQILTNHLLYLAVLSANPAIASEKIKTANIPSNRPPQISLLSAEQITNNGQIGSTETTRPEINSLMDTFTSRSDYIHATEDNYINGFFSNRVHSYVTSPLKNNDAQDLETRNNLLQESMARYQAVQKAILEEINLDPVNDKTQLSYAKWYSDLTKSMAEDIITHHQRSLLKSEADKLIDSSNAHNNFFQETGLVATSGRSGTLFQEATQLNYQLNEQEYGVLKDLLETINPESEATNSNIDKILSQSRFYSYNSPIPNDIQGSFSPRQMLGIINLNQSETNISSTVINEYSSALIRGSDINKIETMMQKLHSFYLLSIANGTLNESASRNQSPFGTNNNFEEGSPEALIDEISKKIAAFVEFSTQVSEVSSDYGSLKIDALNNSHAHLGNLLENTFNKYDNNGTYAKSNEITHNALKDFYENINDDTIKQELRDVYQALKDPNETRCSEEILNSTVNSNTLKSLAKFIQTRFRTEFEAMHQKRINDLEYLDQIIPAI